MDKAPDAFRTISEVADDLDVPQHVLRFWESRFPQIKPMKRAGGRRYYRPDDVDLLRGIRHLLYGEGYTIRGVQRILREQGPKFVQAVWQPGAAQPPTAPGDETPRRGRATAARRGGAHAVRPAEGARRRRERACALPMRHTSRRERRPHGCRAPQLTRDHVRRLQSALHEAARVPPVDRPGAHRRSGLGNRHAVRQAGHADRLVRRHVRPDRADRLVRRRSGRRARSSAPAGRRCWSCIARVVAVAGAGVGWWLLFPRELRPSLWLCVLLRFVREAANALLPLAQIGGDFIGARCLALQGIRGTVAAASVIVDVLMQAVTQLVFAIVGLVLLVALRRQRAGGLADRDRHRHCHSGARRFLPGAGRARPARW